MVVAQAERLKNVKYSHLVSSHYFVPFVVETSGVLGEAAEDLIWDLGQLLHQSNGEPHNREHLMQRISIAVQRGNAAAVLGTAGSSVGAREGEDPFWE